MSQFGGPGGDAVPIGDIVAPPLARLPQPEALFRRRSERFAVLAAGHELGPYLAFLAAIAKTQAEILPGLPEPERPSDEARERSRAHAMPPLDRARLPEDPACRETLRLFIAEAARIEMPADAREALDELARAEDETLARMAGNVAADAIPAHDTAAHIFIGAGLQVHAARAASRLDASALVPVGDGICPVCGGPPTSSVIVGWEGSNGARFCSCSLCATLWNFVRIRCVSCGSTKGITYRHLGAGDQDGNGAVKAECCNECRSFAKIMQQARHPELDPVADDVATLALDMLLTEDGLRRGGHNLYMLGY